MRQAGWWSVVKNMFRHSLIHEQLASNVMFIQPRHGRATDLERESWKLLLGIYFLSAVMDGVLLCLYSAEY